MRTYEISSPAAAELYFNQSFVGDVATLVHVAIDKLANRASKRPSKGRQAPRHDAQRQNAQRQSMLDRLDRWFWRQQQKAQESYLANAQDVFDLERRIEAIDRGSARPYY